MTSRIFFGNHKFKDVTVTLFNEENEIIYHNSYTTFSYVNPTINGEVKDALDDYKEHWKYNGTPSKCEIFTTPTYNMCVIDLVTYKKTFS